MASFGSWAAIATVVAAAVAIVALGGGTLFRAGRPWERVRRLTDVTEQNQETIRELEIEVDRLWVVHAEGVEMPEDPLPGGEGEEDPIQQELIGREEDEENDADGP